MKAGAADYIIKDRLTRLGPSVRQALEHSAADKERKRFQEELIEEKALFRGLVDTVPDQIYFKDRESRFIRINEIMARRFKLTSPSEAVGKTDADFNNSERALWGLGQGVPAEQQSKVVDALVDLHNSRSNPQMRSSCRSLVTRYGGADAAQRLAK